MTLAGQLDLLSKLNETLSRLAGTLSEEGQAFEEARAAEAAFSEETRATTDQLAELLAASEETGAAQQELADALPPATEAVEAQAGAWRELGDAVGPVPAEVAAAKAEMGELERIGEDLGRTFSGAFEDLIIGGEDFSDVLKGLEQDLLRLLETSLFGAGGVGGFISETLGGLLAGVLFPGGEGFRHGGLVQGPGSARGDSIPARLSAGEFVVNAAATRRNRELLEAINADLVPAGFAAGGLAGFGLLREPQAATRPVPSIPAQSASGGDTFNVEINGVSDFDSFERSQGQILGMLGEAVALARRRHM